MNPSGKVRESKRGRKKRQPAEHLPNDNLLNLSHEKRNLSANSVLPKKQKQTAIVTPFATRARSVSQSSIQEVDKKRDSLGSSKSGKKDFKDSLTRHKVRNEYAHFQYVNAKPRVNKKQSNRQEKSNNIVKYSCPVKPRVIISNDQKIETIKLPDSPASKSMRCPICYLYFTNLKKLTNHKCYLHQCMMLTPKKSATSSVQKASYRRRSQEHTANDIRLLLSDISSKLPNNGAVVISGGSRLRCPNCSYSTDDAVKISRHHRSCKHKVSADKEMRTKNLKWQCLICHSLFETSSDLLKHVPPCEYRTGLKYWCGKCGFGFSSPLTLVDHLCEEKVNKMNACFVNVLKLPTPATPKSRKPRSVTPCSMCSEVFTYNYLYRIHKKSHEKRTAKIIPQKRKGGGNPTSATAKRIRVKAETSSETVPEPVVKAEADSDDTESTLESQLPFSRGSSLSGSSSSSVSESYKCRICSEPFGNLDAFEFHVKVKHRIVVKDTSKQCIHCKASFVTSLALELHMCPRVSNTVNPARGICVDSRSESYDSNSSLPDNKQLIFSRNNLPFTDHPNVVSVKLPRVLRSREPSLADISVANTPFASLSVQTTKVGPSKELYSSLSSNSEQPKESFPVISGFQSLASNANNPEVLSNKNQVLPDVIDSNNPESLPNKNQVLQESNIEFCSITNSESPDAYAVRNCDDPKGSVSGFHFICKCFQSFYEKEEFTNHCAEKHGINLDCSIKVHIIDDSD